MTGKKKMTDDELRRRLTEWDPGAGASPPATMRARIRNRLDGAEGPGWTGRTGQGGLPGAGHFAGSRAWPGFLMAAGLALVALLVVPRLISGDGAAGTTPESPVAAGTGAAGTTPELPVANVTDAPEPASGFPTDPAISPPSRSGDALTEGPVRVVYTARNGVRIFWSFQQGDAPGL